MTPQPDANDANRLRLGIAAGVVGGALLVSVVGLVLEPTAFWGGYLAAVAVWLGVGLGCLGTVLLHSLTGGNWGEAIGRELRAGFGPLGVGLLAALPLAVGAALIYPAAGSTDESVLNSHQKTYFEPILLIGRLLLFSVVWCGLSAWLLWANNRRRSGNYATAVSPRKAALGLLAFWLTATFAAVDGLMSLSPHWASSMFPLMTVIGAGVAGLAFVIVARCVSLGSAPLTEQQRSDTHDLGNMLQAYNMMWTYLAFSQYLIIWSGDVASEVTWYLARRGPLMSVIAVSLFLFHFVVPFLLLLSRDLKRDPRKLAAVAGLLLLMRVLADAWIVVPSTPAGHGWGVVLAFSNAVAIGAGCLLGFIALRRRLPERTAASAHAHGEHATRDVGEATS